MTADLRAQRIRECQELLAREPHLQAIFEVTEFGKLHHKTSGKDILPKDYKVFERKPDLTPCAEPEKISRFLQTDKHNPSYLYCGLTKSRVRNTEADALKHTDGALYKKKMFEHWKATMIKRKKELEFQLR